MKGTALILVCLLGLSAGYEDKSVGQWLQDNNYHTLVDALNVTGLLNDLKTGGMYFFYLHFPFPCRVAIVQSFRTTAFRSWGLELEFSG